MSDNPNQSPRRLNSVGRVLGRIVRDSQARNRESRLQRIETDILTVQGVANLLHCSEQAVRNTPENELPRYLGRGKRVLFFKEDVIRYLRGTRRTNPAADEIVRDIENGPIESSSDSG
ncbi:MAG: helix-turn-helix domain-containing protein [Alphaproteobacteria bacterium]|nr:helix-turn-helix domain-containing protein [Alphaproteobacteria bacterium]